MCELHPKWIIEDGIFKLRKVEYHKDISDGTTKNKENIPGGGWFYIDTDSKTIYLYGKSEDFGQASFEKVEKALNNEIEMVNRFKGFKYMYTDNLKLQKADWPNWKPITIKPKIERIRELYQEEPEFAKRYEEYCKSSPLLSGEEIAWNIIIDYDDHFNTKIKGRNPRDQEPYPYSTELYNKISNIME